MEGEPVNREPLAISRQPLAGRVAARRGFTLIELMVSVALLVAVILMVAQIFDISTKAASRTNAQSEVFAANAALRERMTADVSRMLPGFLVINSPPPTPVRAEVPGGEAIFRVRQDSLMFVAGGAPGQYESLTDPTRGEPDNGVTVPAGRLRPTQWVPTASSAALMYYGPAEPMDASGNARPLDLPADPRPPTASEWVFVNRALLIGSEANAGVGYWTTVTPPTPSPPWWTQYVQWKNTLDADAIVFQNSLASLGVLNVPDNYLNGSMDVFFRQVTPAVGQITATEFIDRLNTKLSGIGLGSFPGSLLENLWQPGRAPMSASLRDPTAFDYYKRNGANFMPRMADIRIEWTDGRSVDPPPPYANNPNLSTRWFGLRADINYNPNPANPAGLNGQPFEAWRRGDQVNYYGGSPTAPQLLVDAYGTETSIFNNVIESADLSGSNAAYRAVWRKDNWQYRPKALRITYRLFDVRNKLESDTTVDLDDDDRPDPEGSATPYVLKRYGQEFSVVIPVP